MTFTIKTNNVPRYTIDAYQLTEKERQEFDYIDWQAIDEGSNSATFFRYKGMLYDLGEFMRVENNESLKGWDGYSSDSAFSGVMIKWADSDCESVIVATYYS